MSNCNLALSDPGAHLIETMGVPKDENDFYPKATAYCHQYAKCYGNNNKCLTAVLPDRMGGKGRRRKSRRKSKRKSTKKRRRKRRKSTKKKRRRRRK